jgi:hypothetical protein
MRARRIERIGGREMAVIDLRLDEVLRTTLRRDVLSHVVGMNPNRAPFLRWMLEKSDGSFDCSDGTNISSGAAAARKGIVIYLEGHTTLPYD